MTHVEQIADFTTRACFASITARNQSVCGTRLRRGIWDTASLWGHVPTYKPEKESR